MKDSKRWQQLSLPGLQEPTQGQQALGRADFSYQLRNHRYSAATFCRSNLHVESAFSLQEHHMQSKTGWVFLFCTGGLFLITYT